MKTYYKLLGFKPYETQENRERLSKQRKIKRTRLQCVVHKLGLLRESGEPQGIVSEKFIQAV